jgi:endonuclease/exonuclease/phosphatase family metal-dependent hydrolase
MEPPEKFRCATWNIDQAKREENYEETRFDNRWPKILEYIKEVKPDVFALQELRNLETSKIDLPQILFQIAQLGYDYKHIYYNETKSSFAQAIFYDRDKFFIRNIGSTILPSISSTDSRQLLMLQLVSLKSKRVFWFATTHLSMIEEEKAVCVKYIKEIFSKMMNSEVPFLCTGDFNFFDDLDGKAHRAVLESVFPDVAYPLKNASGTFMGYAHDPNAKPFNAMSRLDHIFCGGSGQALKCEPAFVHGDLKLVEDRKYPSDHLMIVLDFELCA